MVSFQAEIVFFVSSHHFIATIYMYLLIIMYFRLIKSNTLQEECLITKVLEHHLHIQQAFGTNSSSSSLNSAKCNSLDIRLLTDLHHNLSKENQTLHSSIACLNLEKQVGGKDCKNVVVIYTVPYPATSKLEMRTDVEI